MSFLRLHFVMISLSLISYSPLAIAPIFGDENLVVHLSTAEEEEVKNLYLAKLRPCETEYQKQIYETLQRDLLMNQSLSLLEIDEQRQYLAHHVDPQVAFQVSKWREAHARYVIVPTIEKKALNVKIFDVKTASLKYLNAIPLSESLTKDIHGVHKVADTIQSITTGTSGIASKRILYSFQPKPEPEESGVWHSEIWEMDITGSSKRQITEENHYSITPTFLPSSEGENYDFLYVTYKQGPPRIYLASKEEPRGKPLIPLRGNQLLPAISPKGDKIAFISDAGGKTDLFVQAFQKEKGLIGKPVQVYSFPGSVQASPTFSPDGNQIAFVSDKSGTPRIYVIHLLDVLKTRKIPDVQVITKKNRDNSGPAWSPDGKKIAFSAKTNGIRQIWIYEVETGEERQLTTGLGDKENPSWAPDNYHLVYNTTSPTYDIFLMNIIDAKPKRLTDGPGIKHYPSFER